MSKLIWGKFRLKIIVNLTLYVKCIVSRDKISVFQWRIQRGAPGDTRLLPLPPGQIFFIFMQFLRKTGQNISLGLRPGGLAPVLWEILDPQLYPIEGFKAHYKTV